MTVKQLGLIKRKLCLGVTLLAIILVLQGCATVPKGELFNPISDVKPEESIIYIFWDEPECKTDFTLKANEATIGTLAAGSYIPHRTVDKEITLKTHLQFGMGKAGIADVASAKTSEIKIDIEQEGSPVFVLCRSGSVGNEMFLYEKGFKNRLYMMIVDPAIGESKIKSCRLLK